MAVFCAEKEDSNVKIRIPGLQVVISGARTDRAVHSSVEPGSDYFQIVANLRKIRCGPVDAVTITMSDNLVF